MKVLDCTLRDGGYYNNWNFSKPFIEKYLNIMNSSSVDIVELGLRMPSSTGFKGAVAFTTEGFINSLEIPKNLEIGVMINTKDFKDIEHLGGYFSEKKDSRVSLVRVASHFSEIDKSLEFIDYLKNLGYTTGLNLMQIGVQENSVILETSKKISKLDSLDVLYFADSLGNMDQEDVDKTINILREFYKGSLGIHAHNNMYKALSNTIFAAENGVEWLDSTVLGMGRGAGNTQTELLLTELNQKLNTNYEVDSLYLFVLDDFTSLKKKYDWGPDLLYYLAGKYEVHPTFIQQLKSQGVVGAHDLVNAMEVLKEIESSSYRKLNLNKLIYNNDEENVSHSPCYIPEVDSRDILIVANGMSSKKMTEDITKFKNAKDLFCISLNVSEAYNPEAIDLLMMCNPARILSSLDKLNVYSSKIMMPKSRLNKTLQGKLQPLGVLDYDLKISNDPSYDESGCVLESPLVLGYALSYIMALNKKKVYFAGLDGYKSDGEKNTELRNLINFYVNKNKDCEFISITPTRLGFIEKSIYEKDMLYNR